MSGSRPRVHVSGAHRELYRPPEPLSRFLANLVHLAPRHVSLHHVSAILPQWHDPELYQTVLTVSTSV